MSKKILLIDDDSDIREVLNAILEIQNFSLITAVNGKDGIAKFRENKKEVSLILLDIMLPDIDGYQVLQVIRAESKTPIIMLTARDRNTDKILGLELGADDYMVKPFDTLELLARIKAVLRRIEDVKENLDKDIVINEDKRRVSIKDKNISLTPTEFDLFCYLYKNKNKVVTRNDIKEALWADKDLYQWSRAIDVHISHIREKLEDDPENPTYLVTVPQKGYKLKI